MGGGMRRGAPYSFVDEAFFMEGSLAYSYYSLFISIYIYFFIFIYLSFSFIYFPPLFFFFLFFFFFFSFSEVSVALLGRLEVWRDLWCRYGGSLYVEVGWNDL